MPVVVGVDIGGTKVLGVAVGAGTVVLRRVYETHSARGPSAVADLVASIVARCADGERVSAVGIAVAGWLGPGRDTVLRAANLGLRDDRLGAAVAVRAGAPVVLDNDGNAAALAEDRFGAARGCRVSMTVTVGTGVGGGVVVDGRLLAGAHGLAGEVGHMCLDEDGPACVCGGRGCLESYASGPAIARAADRPSAFDVVRAARSGDRVALAALSAAGSALGRGIGRLAVALDPDIVVIGGGVAAGAGGLLLDPVRRALRAAGSLSVVADPPVVRPAACATDAGALGAAALATDEAAVNEGVGG
jgi:glucokinase